MSLRVGETRAQESVSYHNPCAPAKPIGAQNIGPHISVIQLPEPLIASPESLAVGS